MPEDNAIIMHISVLFTFLKKKTNEEPKVVNKKAKVVPHKV